MKFTYVAIICVVLFVIFAAVNYFYISKFSDYSTTLYLVMGVVMATPLIIIKYAENQRLQSYEKNFSIFLQDLVESIRGGMTVPQAFKAISRNQYGPLTSLVKKMSAQLDWGIPVETVLTKFAKETNSRIITRIVSTVMESHKFGGNLSETFEALSSTVTEVERLRSERKVLLNSQIITGYIIFFVFLIVIIGLQKYLVPSLSQVSTASLTQINGVGAPPNISQQYAEIFRNLVLIQGLFTGLTVGKMSEGAMVSGIKHSAFMMVVGLFVLLVLGQ
ncbi:MAG: type II secretion system F family protein [Candidatus Aenigmarchaeota archaeon]|nr:type II secretion system F family protein [Candidatus Aenigmarchaeota archaeon]